MTTEPTTMKDFSVLCQSIERLSRLTYNELNAARGKSTAVSRELVGQLLAQAACLYTVVTLAEPKDE